MSASNVQHYWDHYGEDPHYYDTEIASSIDEDIHSTIKQNLMMEASSLALARKEQSITVCDYGCGPGKWLSKIDRAFGHVIRQTTIYALDVSQQLVGLASKALPTAYVQQVNLENLSDIQQAVPSVVDFGICANVLIAAERSTRRRILSNIQNTTSKGSIVIFVVPSLESALYCEWRWLQDGPPIVDTDGDEIPHKTGKDASNILNGCLERDGVRTKHYLREEFVCVAAKFDFSIKKICKASYNWSMEFGDEEDVIPEHLSQSNAEGPWDWCFVAERM